MLFHRWGNESQPMMKRWVIINIDPNDSNSDEAPMVYVDVKTVCVCGEFM